MAQEHPYAACKAESADCEEDRAHRSPPALEQFDFSPFSQYLSSQRSRRDQKEADEAKKPTGEEGGEKDAAAPAQRDRSTPARSPEHRQGGEGYAAALPRIKKEILSSAYKDHQAQGNKKKELLLKRREIFDMYSIKGQLNTTSPTANKTNHPPQQQKQDGSVVVKKSTSKRKRTYPSDGSKNSEPPTAADLKALEQRWTLTAPHSPASNDGEATARKSTKSRAKVQFTLPPSHDNDEEERKGRVAPTLNTTSKDTMSFLNDVQARIDHIAYLLTTREPREHHRMPPPRGAAPAVSTVTAARRQANSIDAASYPAWLQYRKPYLTTPRKLSLHTAAAATMDSSVAKRSEEEQEEQNAAAVASTDEATPTAVQDPHAARLTHPKPLYAFLSPASGDVPAARPILSPEKITSLSDLTQTSWVNTLHPRNQTTKGEVAGVEEEEEADPQVFVPPHLTSARKLSYCIDDANTPNLKKNSWDAAEQAEEERNAKYINGGGYTVQLLSWLSELDMNLKEYA
ncbi:hypothetical protein STCU_11339 [Strigomonas culicis]|uniref:Uncharacterized protein n=1 Tax=Strigomonas culicis TaxID=28005 RepID=S9TE92_9TRYP|nr:hypothetical protein STCU_11339 [Strigomonas culicis]|eukprot:EPY16377.1 hypothetical protein STCU_11339 [Strigomonas culicis]